jgi:hypothetical protein
MIQPFTQRNLVAVMALLLSVSFATKVWAQSGKVSPTAVKKPELNPVVVPATPTPADTTKKGGSSGDAKPTAITAASVQEAVKKALDKYVEGADNEKVMTLHFKNRSIRATTYTEKSEAEKKDEKKSDKKGWKVSATDSLTIDSVAFEVQVGRISQIYAYTHSGNGGQKIFSNSRSSISLMHYENRRDDVLANYSGTEEYIKIKDLFFIIYQSARRYMPADGPYTLRYDEKVPKHNVIPLSAGASLSSLVEASVYTDLLGLLNKENNGIVSVELASQIPWATDPIIRNSNIFAFQFIRPYASYSRLDSKIDTIHLRGTKFDYVDRADLLQRAYFRYGANVNLLGINGRRPHSFALNAGWTGAISRVTDGKRDSIGVIRERNAYSKTWNVEGVASFRRLGNFGIDIGINFLFNHIANSSLVTNDGYERIIKPSALVYFHPKNAPENRIFLRLASWSFMEHGDRNFFQVQFGYTIGIGSVVKSFGAATPQAAANLAPGSPLN